MTAAALPFPVSDIQPAVSLNHTNPPLIGFTLPNSLTSSSHLSKLNCFASGMDKIKIEKLGTHRIEIRLDKPFDDSKGRLNCTLPVPSLDGTGDMRWRWLGFLFVLPDGRINLPQL